MPFARLMHTRRFVMDFVNYVNFEGPMQQAPKTNTRKKT
jgi:hypothetical protein